MQEGEADMRLSAEREWYRSAFMSHSRIQKRRRKDTEDESDHFAQVYHPHSSGNAQMISPEHINPDSEEGSIPYSQDTPISDAPGDWAGAPSQVHAAMSDISPALCKTSPKDATDDAMASGHQRSVMSPSSRPARMPTYEPNTTKIMLAAHLANETDALEILATTHSPISGIGVMQMGQPLNGHKSSQPLESFCLIKEGVVSVEVVKYLVMDFFEHYHPFFVSD